MGYEKTAEEKVRERPVVLRRRRERIKSEKNGRLFYYQFNRDHALPHLIWNFKVRSMDEALNSRNIKESINNVLAHVTTNVTL